jgi:[citrate (pro-3S)-lyase] ligase
MVTFLMREQIRRGQVHFFIFTKPSLSTLFANLGFKEIVRLEPLVALLENGLGSLADWCRKMSQILSDLPLGRTSLVMNCNPITKGHEALIQRAACENEAVIVFIVSEDSGPFPLNDRIHLAHEVLKDLPNVRVIPSGKYQISQATFPGYFLKGSDPILIQTLLDATLFAEKIAPALNIVSRYVGQEPYSKLTQTYNESLLEVLPKFGLTVKVIERLAVAGVPVSASNVREAWRMGDWAKVASLVPSETLAYLQNQDTKRLDG